MASPALMISEMFEPGAENLSAPVLDLVHLARQSLGDRALESELLQLFHRQSAHIMSRLADPSVTDAKRRADLAHTLKGSARAVGAHGVAAAAQAYERAMGAGPSAPLAQRNLESAVAEACAAIDDLLGG